MPRLISKAKEGKEVYIYSFADEILETEIITVLYVIMCHQCVFECIYRWIHDKTFLAIKKVNHMRDIIEPWNFFSNHSIRLSCCHLRERSCLSLSFKRLIVDRSIELVYKARKPLMTPRSERVQSAKLKFAIWINRISGVNKKKEMMSKLVHNFDCRIFFNTISDQLKIALNLLS